MGIGLLDEMILDNKFMYASAVNGSARELGRLEVLAIPYMDPETQSYSSLKETESLLVSALDKLVKGDISDELFEAVKLNDLQSYDRMMEYSMQKAYLLLQGYVYQEPFEELFSEKERLAKLTKDEVIRIAKKYFSAPHKTFQLAN